MPLEAHIDSFNANSDIHVVILPEDVMLVHAHKLESSLWLCDLLLDDPAHDFGSVEMVNDPAESAREGAPRGDLKLAAHHVDFLIQEAAAEGYYIQMSVMEGAKVPTVGSIDLAQRVALEREQAKRQN
jgi:hypothetical protein